jgi:hypothetical protein
MNRLFTTANDPAGMSKWVISVISKRGTDVGFYPKASTKVEISLALTSNHGQPGNAPPCLPWKGGKSPVSR